MYTFPRYSRCVKLIRRLLMAAAAWFLPLVSLAQRPTHVPGEDGPLRVFESVESIIFYIVLPLVIVVLYIIWRRRLRLQQDEKEAGNRRKEEPDKGGQA